MQIYTVHYRSEAAVSLSGLAEDTIFVKEGFSWPALAIPLVWLIYKRMWWVLVAYVTLQMVFTGLAGATGLSESAVIICSMGINLILGFEGNDLYRWSLARRRYRFAAIVTGAGLEDAEHRFFAANERSVVTPNAGATP